MVCFPAGEYCGIDWGGTPLLNTQKVDLMFPHGIPQAANVTCSGIDEILSAKCNARAKER